MKSKCHRFTNIPSSSWQPSSLPTHRFKSTFRHLLNIIHFFKTYGFSGYMYIFFFNRLGIGVFLQRRSFCLSIEQYASDGLNFRRLFLHRREHNRSKLHSKVRDGHKQADTDTRKCTTSENLHIVDNENWVIFSLVRHRSYLA